MGRMNLARFSRVRFGNFPTPWEHFPNLTRHLNGPEIWIKRDDCTGMSTGGNKTRKLEFLMAEARDQGADIVLTQGATQSNHARQTAAFAARMGMGCHILLEDRTGKTDREYTQNGNVFLDYLHGASVEYRPVHPDMNGEMEQGAAKFRGEGRRPYTRLGGGCSPTGALGCVNCAMELIVQANDIGLKIDHIVHATGTAGTQGGLVAGLCGMGPGGAVLWFGGVAPPATEE